MTRHARGEVIDIMLTLFSQEVAEENRVASVAREARADAPGIWFVNPRDLPEPLTKCHLAPYAGVLE